MRENHVGFMKEDGIELSMALTREDELEYSSDENGDPYKTLQDLYKGMKGDGGETITIAGCEGFRVGPIEDDRYIDAGFVLKNGFYYISMNTDYNAVLPGNNSATSFSEEDIKAFDAFLGSIKPGE